MRQIAAGLFISLDGVVEAPENWTGPYFNDQVGQAVGALMATNDAIPTIIAVPTMALEIPEPGIPTGRSTLIKKSMWLTAGSPLRIVYPSTRPRGTRASAVSA